MKKIALVQVGYGTVGGAVIRQVLENRAKWQQAFNLDVRFAAVSSSKGVVLTETDSEITDDQLLEICNNRGSGARGTSVSDIIPTIANADAVILIDAAAGEATADSIVAALDAGSGAVLSNKAPLSLPLSDSRAKSIWKHAGFGGRLRYEATCGAGLV